MWRKFILISLGIYGIGCGVSQSLMSLGGALFALAFGGLFFTGFRQVPRPAPLFALAWVGYSALNLLARGWDERTGHTLGALPMLLVPATALLWNARPERRLRREDFAWPLTLVSLALIASVAKASWQFFGQGQQAYGFLRNPIYFAYNLLPACVVFAELAWRRLRCGFYDPAWAGAVSGLCLFGIVCSVSRTAFVCAGGYLAFRALPHLRQRGGWRSVAFATLLAASAGGGLAIFNPATREKLVRTFSTDDPARHWRFVAWRHNWELFSAAPLTGTGPERNGIDTAKMPQYAGHWQPHTLIFAHSIYLQSLADNGLLGTALLLGFWVAFAGSAPLAGPVVAMAALGGLTENIFNNSKSAHAVFFYALLCAFIGAAAPARGPRDEPA